MVRTFTVSLRIAARTKKVIIAAHMNRTRSTGGILSVTPAMTARNVGINAACRSTRPIHPIDSAVLGTSLFSRKYLIPSLTLPSRSIQLPFVEDVFSNLCDSLFSPFGVDVVCMII